MDIRKFYYLLVAVFVGLSVNAQQNSDTLRLMFVGDIMSHKPQLASAYDAVTKQYDYTENYKYLTPIFHKADFVFANLETTVGTKPYSGYPQFSAPIALVRAGKNAGITHFATANNHSCDKRKRGIIGTLNVLDSLQVAHFGTYRNLQEKQNNTPLLIQKNGFTLALLNYTYGTNGLPTPKPTVVNRIDKRLIKKDIEKAKTMHPDGIIVFLHWGNQYQNKASKQQKDLAKWLHQQGVAMVIGSHPHVIQPISIRIEKPTALQQELTVYSLGNFISNQRTFPRAGSMIVVVQLIKNTDGKLKISKFETLPIWVYKYAENKKWHYEILPIEQFKFNPVYFKKNTYYQDMMRYLMHYKRILAKNSLIK
jgi:poly-gamma-glutamate synthesis protein (capsule biosynthesis protein)